MSTITLNLSTSPYGRQLYKTGIFEFMPGKTVLIGRNGAGKTTVLNLVEEYCKNNQIPYFKFDNYTKGGSTALQDYLFHGDFEGFVGGALHSEGEQIYNNLCNQSRKIGNFIRQHSDSKQIFILFDALDSGFDLDGFKQVNNLCDLILKDNSSIDVYLLISANNYGMVEGNPCYDVRSNQYVEICCYDDFKAFILKQYEDERSKTGKI